MGPTWGLQWKNISTAENICDTQHGLPVATTPITDRMNAMRLGEQALAGSPYLHFSTTTLHFYTSVSHCHHAECGGVARGQWADKRSAINPGTDLKINKHCLQQPHPQPA